MCSVTGAAAPFRSSSAVVRFNPARHGANVRARPSRRLGTASVAATLAALIGPQTPEVISRLFGGKFDAWATFPHQRLAGVPDPAFWLVMEYWRLGDWRRPRA